jgi:hypothetical protein
VFREDLPSTIVPLEIVYQDPGGVGYHPVAYMVRLAAELLDAKVAIVRKPEQGRLSKLLSLAPRARSGGPGLVICPSPVEMSSLFAVEGWRRKYGRMVAWVFDSFWVDMIPRWVQFAKHFDHVFVTEQEDLDGWRRVLGGVPVDWLPWGSDVLRLGSPNAHRPVDLVRVGRQPPEWEDDATTAADAEARGLQFRGRPPGKDDPAENERVLMSTFSETKFTLSFSNAVNSTVYTHRARQYITGRWTDALASGATVAGVPPRSPGVSALLWPEALLDTGGIERASGMEIITSAARAWSPARAERNWRMSLERLDWRWRFDKLRDALGIRSPRLDAELATLRRRLTDQPPTATAAASASR